MKKAVIILNPVAGRAKAKNSLFDMIVGLGRQNYETFVHVTKARGDATTAAEKFSEKVDLVICCGGDGTLNEVIAGLLKSEKHPKLLYYPSGTTNDFATTLGLPKNLSKAIKNIDEREVFPLDIGLIKDISSGKLRHFTYVASFGIFTKSSYSADQSVKNLLGHFAYILKGMEELGDLGKSYHVTVEHDSGSIEGNYILCAVTNSTSVGGVLKLPSEIVKLSDGVLEILLIKSPANIIELNNLISMLVQNKYDGDNIVFIQTTKAKIKAHDNPPWCTDGEYAGKISCAEISCVHKAVNMVR